MNVQQLGRIACEPLYAEVSLPAPLPDVFAAFLGSPDPVFLDSSLTHSHLGRYSYLAADPLITLTSKDGQISVGRRDENRSGTGNPNTVSQPDSGGTHDGTSENPFAELQRLLRAYPTRLYPDLPPFQGGAIGYFAYDLGRHLEVLPRTTVDDIGMPDLYVGLYPWVLSHDHMQNRTWLVVNPIDGDQRTAELQLADLLRRVALIEGNGRIDLELPRQHRSKPICNFTRDGYLLAVAAAKSYISEGDIYQVCLSQCFAADLQEHPWQFYRRLREVSPVPYGAYLGFAGATVVSSSPELFLRLEEGRVETRPIKGTRPRGRTSEEDVALAESLIHSEKDRAENVMIVDLLRNDLGRACRVGSVRVPELFALESYSTVHHLVSTVQGQLRPELDAVDLLRCCFPGGSVTGCPKIRAMEIIDELEPTQRGVYCGAIGFIGFNGEMDTSIVIRTAVVEDGRAYFQVGGAIVADSDPADEYQETLDKARGMLLALGAAT